MTKSLLADVESCARQSPQATGKGAACVSALVVCDVDLNIYIEILIYET